MCDLVAELKPKVVSFHFGLPEKKLLAPAASAWPPPGGSSPRAPTSSSGFSDQSQFSRHFKRLVGMTPGQFRSPARIA
jgi:hypothetical protein